MINRSVNCLGKVSGRQKIMSLKHLSTSFQKLKKTKPREVLCEFTVTDCVFLNYYFCCSGKFLRQTKCKTGTLLKPEGKLCFS